MTRTLHFALFAALCCTARLVCAAPPAPPVVNVGFYEFPPYSYSDADGKPRGAILQLTERLLRHAGYRAAFRSQPSARLYAGLRDGSVQIWPGAPGKPELVGHTLESQTTLGQISLNLYFRRDTLLPRIPEDLAGRNVILIGGYSYWPAFNALLDDRALNIHQHRTGTHIAALEMLQRHRGDFLLDYQTPVEQARRQIGMEELPFMVLQRIPLRLILSRHSPGSEALREALDRAYAELVAAGEDLSLP
ncbi:MAG: transporter substrate-binding domain-containing protein [Pseudomonadota bacterium]